MNGGYNEATDFINIIPVIAVHGIFGRTTKDSECDKIFTGNTIVWKGRSAKR